MRAVFILLSLWTLYCKVSPSLPPSPTSVTFSSVNLRNTLQWFPGNGTREDARFTVQYAIYGDSTQDGKGGRVNWRAVQRCTEIMRSWCDLSSETRDLEQRYYARVRAASRRASSRWSQSDSFDPKSDTSFGPPLVSVEREDNSAVITLMGPMRYEPNNHTPLVSLARLYPQMMYNLSIRNSHRGHTNHLMVISSPYKLRLMEYDTEYCFSAKTKFLSMPVQCQPSEWHCIHTPPDPVIAQLQRVIMSIAVPSVCMCMLIAIGYILYQYLTGKGQKSPYILHPPSFNQPLLTFPPEKPNLILISIVKPESDPERLRQQRITDPQPGHAPLNAPPEPEELLDDLSVDYGFVGVAPQIDNTGGEERERRHDGEEDGNNLKGEHQKCRSSGISDQKVLRLNRSAGVYAPQTESYHAQSSTHTLQTHTLSEMSSLTQTHAFPQLSSVQTQTQAPLRSEDREFPGLFISSSQRTDPFHLETSVEGGIEEEMDGKVAVRAEGKIDGGVKEGSDRVPLLSASQKDYQSESLPDDYGVLRMATADQIDKDDDDKREVEDEGAIFIDWDPKTGKLLLPETVMGITKVGGSDGSCQGEGAQESRAGGEEEEGNGMRGKLTLDNVYVRQASEEEEEQRALERGGGGGWEDILTKWNLVISMDQ